MSFTCMKLVGARLPESLNTTTASLLLLNRTRYCSSVLLAPNVALIGEEPAAAPEPQYSAIVPAHAS